MSIGNLPETFEPTNLSRDNLGREIGRKGLDVETEEQKRGLDFEARTQCLKAELETEGRTSPKENPLFQRGVPYSEIKILIPKVRAG